MNAEHMRQLAKNLATLGDALEESSVRRAHMAPAQQRELLHEAAELARAEATRLADQQKARAA